MARKTADDLLNIIQVGRLHYLVESRSEDGYHCVDLEPVEDWPEGGCTCRGFTVRKTCRHYRAVLARLTSSLTMV